jgi:hypothetical protein
MRRDNIVHPTDKTRDPNKREEPKDLREANENIRRSQGDDATGPTENNKAGNRPAFDRDR